MKKPLFNEAEREQIKKQEGGSAYERYVSACIIRGAIRAMANVIDREGVDHHGNNKS